MIRAASRMDKSCHIARKIASTMASTGTPAYFVHPAEAIHGDIGMIARDDVLIALSNSGESEELLTIVPLLKRQGARLIAITGNANSSLAREADVHLDARVEKEACPLNLAPTASTTAALAPGGALGRRLLTHVRDVMRIGDDMPSVPDSAGFSEAMLEMSKKGIGMTAVLDAAGRVSGVFTDGDLRRTLAHVDDIKTACIADLMTRNPRTIGPDKLAVEAVQ